MNGKSVALFIALFIAATTLPVRGQQNVNSRNSSHTVTLAADPNYEAGSLHRFFFGAHYRDLWATPLKVEVLDLDRFAGGLTPLKRGGRRQTKSLRFLGKDGRQYVFRSIDKDPSKVLPPELQETLASDILQDQISSAHPFAALMVGPLAKALGVLYAEPRLAVMPDDPRLGEFRAEFRQLMGFIEERPNDGPDGEPGFAGSDKIIDTQELFAELEKDHDNEVDSEAYLTARLLDIFVGDWDRHVGQWRWARFKKDGKKLWYPIPRDRDQAFAKFDGLLPSLAEKRYVVMELESFDKKTPDIISLTYLARHMDRPFLNDLDEATWHKVTEDFLAKLTDDVITQAVRNLPPEIYAKSGAEFTKKLIARRGAMRKASDEFYRNLAMFVDIKSSNRDEFAAIERQDNRNIDVKIYAHDENATKKDEVIFQRLFKKDETKEIHLYLLGGNDQAVVKGETGGITLRVIGGAGVDALIDSSKTKNYFYDLKQNTKFVAGPHTKIEAGKVDSVVNRYENIQKVRDYGGMTKPLPFFGYNVDDGFFLGGGALIFKYQFRKEPFASQTIALGNYAFKTGAFRLRYSGLFVDFLPNIHLHLAAEVTMPKAVRNFYGFGNATTRDKNLENDDYYRVRSDDYLVRPTFYTFFQKRTYFGLGFAFNHSAVDLSDSTFIKSVEPRPYGVDVASLFELTTELVNDGRNRSRATTKGFYGKLATSYFPKALDNEDHFVKLLADSRTYLGGNNVTLALRLAGERVWGRVPFYEAAFIGGSESLRGFRFQRFAGDLTAWGNAELRLFLTRFRFLVPHDLGVFGFAETGRVWVDGKSEGSWHKDFGGGVWLAPLRREFAITAGVGVSNELTALTIGLGFAF